MAMRAVLGLTMGLAASVALEAEAAGDKARVSFSIHVELPGATGGKNVLEVPLDRPPRNVPISRIPDVSNKDIIGIEPYEALPGAYLISFSSMGAKALMNVTSVSQGKLLLAIVQGRPVYVARIDTALPNGKILIPPGITPDEAQELAVVAKRNRKRLGVKETTP